MRLSESTTTVMWQLAADQAVLPPCGTIAVEVSLAILRMSDTLSGGARPQHHRRVAGPQATELDQVGFASRGR